MKIDKQRQQIYDLTRLYFDGDISAWGWDLADNIVRVLASQRSELIREVREKMSKPDCPIHGAKLDGLNCVHCAWCDGQHAMVGEVHAILDQMEGE